MLKGTLDDFGLADVLRLISLAKKTGRLDVSGLGTRGALYFAGGDVSHASMEPPARSLGELLLERGALTASQLVKVEGATGTHDISPALLSSGIVSQGELAAGMRSLIEDVVFSLWRLEEGEFAWSPSAPPATGLGLSISVENLVMEASRREEELAAMRRKLPADQTVFHLTPEPPGRKGDATGGAISLTRDQWRLLALVNGRRTVAEIAESAALDADATMTMLHGLLRRGLIAHKRQSRSATLTGDEISLLQEAPRETAAGVTKLPSPDWFEDPDITSRPARLPTDDVIDLGEVRRS